MAIDLQRRLGKGSADRRSFLEHAEKYIDELNKHAETMDKLANGFGRGLKYISASGIGIRFEEKPDKSGIKVSGVHLDMPASKASVMAGDILVEIDGITVIGMSQEQASILLRGDAGTSVLITLIRNEQPLKLKLVRAPLINLKPEQRNKLTRDMSNIYDIVTHASQDYRAEADDLNELSKKNINSLTAFEDLITHIEKRKGRLRIDASQLSSYPKSAFLYHISLLACFNFLSHSKINL